PTCTRSPSSSLAVIQGVPLLPQQPPDALDHGPRLDRRQRRGALHWAMTELGRWLSGSSRGVGFAVVSATYVLAGAVGWAVAQLDGHRLAVTFAADVAATVVVFLCLMLVANSSLYDPYWSVAPPVIVAAWIGDGADRTRQVVVLTLVLVWAVRLTANWAWSWRGLNHEDWRYVQLREQTRGRVPWWLVSLTGIQLMPTLVVF